jgi:biopolymer transport protein ExbD
MRPSLISSIAAVLLTTACSKPADNAPRTADPAPRTDGTITVTGADPATATDPAPRTNGTITITGADPATATITFKPATKTTPPCQPATVTLDGSNLIIQLGDQAPTKIAFAGGKPDLTAAVHDACSVAVDANSSTYGDAVKVLDALVTAGVGDVGLVPPPGAELGLPEEPAHPTYPMPDPDSAIQTVPVILIGNDGLKLANTIIAPAAKLDDPATFQALRAELAKRFAAAPGPVVIIQADKSVPASVVARAATAARSAGYDNSLFATKAAK